MLKINIVKREQMHILCPVLLLLVLSGFGAGTAPAAERVRGGKAAAPAAAVPACRVAEFRAIALTLHDPAERRTRVRAWLLEQARGCSLEKLSMIRDNRAVWLGTADTAELAALVDGFIEAQSANGHEILKSLYGGSEVPAKTPG